MLFQPPDPTLSRPPATDAGPTATGPASDTAPHPRPSTETSADGPRQVDGAVPVGERERVRPRRATESGSADGPAVDDLNRNTPGADRPKTEPPRANGPRTAEPGALEPAADPAPAGPKRRVSKATPRVKKATPPPEKATPAARKRADQPPTRTVDAPGEVEHVASAGPPPVAASSVDRDPAPAATGIVPDVPAGLRVGAGDAAPTGPGNAAGYTEPTGPVGATDATAASQPAPPTTTRGRRAAGSRTSPPKKAAPARKATRAKKAAARDTDAVAETGTGRPTPPETEPGPETATATDPAVTSIPAPPDSTAATDQDTTTTAAQPHSNAPMDQDATATAVKPRFPATTDQDTTPTAAQPEPSAASEQGANTITSQPDFLAATGRDDASVRAQPEPIPPMDLPALPDGVPESPWDAMPFLVQSDEPERESESGRTAGADWRTVAARIVDHPGFAPELLAVAAVKELGPRARDWAERARGTYPEADADGLARLATRGFVRLARTGGALAAGAGLFAPAAELAAVLWIQANLVLHLAAVYGRDPGDPDRVAELLVLTQVHPDVGTARAALAAVRSASTPADGPWPHVAEAAWRLATPLAAQVGGWLGLRLASRLLPGAAVLAAAAGDAAAAERLAARATALYRPVRTR